MTPPRMPPSEDGKVYLAYAAKILSALAVEGGARERAAVRLGIPVRSLNRHIEQLGLAELCASEGESAIWPRSVRQPKHDPQPGYTEEEIVKCVLIGVWPSTIDRRLQGAERRSRARSG